MSRVVIEIHEGLIIRDLLENNFLGLLSTAETDVLLISPGAQISEFTNRYKSDGLSFISLKNVSSLSRIERYETILGNILSRKGLHLARRLLWNWFGEIFAAKNATQERQILDDWNPDLAISTHLSQVYGRRLIAVARRRKIPTLGVLKSWDNVWKGLYVRPDVVTCWSQSNKEEICRFESYDPEKVQVIGAPAFDAYMAPDAQWSKDKLCHQLGLDPERPIVLFATLGQFKQQIDETNPIEVLLKAIDSGRIQNNPQVILRLHPWSREIYFKSIINHKDVVVSRYENYVPGLTCTPTREEAILAGNLIHHADVVVSPGSTMSIEPAIFDTPVVVPIFNEYMPEVFEKYFEHIWLNQHFNRLYKNDWLPIVRSGEEMIFAINKVLEDRSWYSHGRQMIREKILGPLDGKATERFANIVIQMLVE